MTLRLPLILCAGLLLSFDTVVAHGQQQPPQVRAPSSGSSSEESLTLSAAIREALAQHASISSARAGVQVAVSELALAKAMQWPTVEGQWQTLRATGSAVAGSHFGMAGVPSVGGPPGNVSPAGGAWGATAALVTTMPITGLLRARRQVDARELRSDAAAAQLEQQQLLVASRAAATFLEVRGAQAQRRAALASRHRAQAIDSITRALALQGLRPGADSMRSAAEVASAEIEVARADRAVAMSNARLADAIGTDRAVRADTGAIRLALPTDRALAVHPAEREAAAVRRASEAEQHVTATAWLPRVDLMGSAFLRGSGEPVPGITSVVPMRGIAPHVGNWALGLVASWPLTGVPAIRAQQRRAAAEVAQASARATLVHNQIEAALAEANASLAGAEAIVARTDQLIRAASATVEQMMARYRAGLTSLVDVADAQRQLTRAEVDDAVARLEVIAAQLQRVQTRGDLATFLAIVNAERAP